MKGDFSRFTFDPQKHYSRVLLQQGRVQLDADWNEQVDILTHQNHTEIKDIVGPSGVPQRDPGFGIIVRHGLNFDDTDGYIRTEASDVFSFADCQPFTIEAWVKPQFDEQGGVKEGVILAKQYFPDSLGEYCLFLRGDGVVVFWQVDIVVSGDSSAVTTDSHTSLHTLVTKIPLLFDHYNHIVVTSDGISLSIYLNGHCAARTSATRSGEKVAAPLLIGASSQEEDGPTQIFQGTIEEIRIWNQAKSHNESKAQMRYPVQGTSAGLVGHWRFDVGQGIAVQDRSSYTNHGTWTGNKAPIWCPPELWVTKGRCYVDGILCENKFDIPFSQQQNAPGLRPPNLNKPYPYLIYLDVWQRLVTAIQDPNLSEVALGGPDTATRTQTVWQVKAQPFKSLPADTVSGCRDKTQLADLFDWPTQLKGRLKMRKQHLNQLDGNFLYRLEIHHGGVSCGQRASHITNPWVAATLKIEYFFRETNKIKVKDWQWELDHNYVGQHIEIFDSVNSCSGVLVEITAQDIDQKLLTLSHLPDELEGYEDPCLQQIATFKWSRENGAVAFPIKGINIEQNTVVLDTWTLDSNALKQGDFVELADDISILQNRVFPFYQIVSIDMTTTASIKVELDRRPPEEIHCDSSSHPLLRRWDHSPWTQMDPSIKSHQGVILVQPNVWISLENGIQVYFEEQGFFQTGDYWWAPARVTTQSITWPERNRMPIAQLPVGINHHYVPLAWCEPDPWQPVLKDLRNFFGPMGTGFVHKTGDTMTGPLTVESSLTVRDDSIFEGDLEVATLYGTLAPDIVSTPQVQDGAITPPKLSSQVGFVPPTFSIVGRTREAPRGYSLTGAQLNVDSGTSHWEDLPTQLPKTGQVTSVCLNNKIYILWESGEMWSYDLLAAPDTSPWSQEADLPPPIRYAYGVVVVDDAIYVVGGYEHPHKKSKRVEAYYPDLREWHIKANLPTARSHLGAGAVNGKLFAIGGFESILWGLVQNFESRVNEMYDPAQDCWICLRSLPCGRSQLGVTTLGGKLYIIGGIRSWFAGMFGKWITKRTDVYSPFTNSWSKCAPLPTAKVDVIAVSTEDQIYAFGSEKKEQNTDHIAVYNLSSNRWTSEIPLAAPRRNYGAILDNGNLYVFGGVGVNGAEDNILRYQLLNSYFLYVKD